MGAEKNFESRIKNFLRSCGVYALGTPMQDMKVEPVGYYEKRWGNKMTTSGLPDLHVVIKGTSLEFEIKAPNGKPSELQKHIIKQMVNAGCPAAIVYENRENIPKDGFEYYIDYEKLKEVIKHYAV